ncbi:putative FAD-binding PCMH-type domain-containing protein [Seiridium cardinale]|uniref:FAD-binding PCMH-type domain-containing protein n=1 Tax=Seiridium cardinale TaxID=138064 RepID=A0ABR2Y3N0_9PEZI
MSIYAAIEAVKKISDNLVVNRGTEKYDEIINSYFSELDRELKPQAFLVPSSVPQVAAIVIPLKPFAKGLQLAICGSGQQATPSVANVHNGLTIHLRNLRGIELDRERRIVSIAAGEQMGKVYELVMGAGYGVAGNRHSSGGIGGDAVQGGLSYFSYARGFVCDDVVNYEIVLASGEVVNANAHTNKDLWLALKGGGNNFGIVTRFDFPVFEQGQLWGGKLFYFQSSFSRQIQSLVDYLHDPDPDVNVHICVSLGYAAALGDILCMNDVFSTRPAKPKALEPFVDIEPQIGQMNTLRVDSLKSFTDEGFAGAPHNRVVKRSTTVKADTSILEYVVKTYSAAFEKLKGVENLLFSMTFEPLPVSMIKESQVRGGNSLGLKLSEGPLVVVLFYTSWDNVKDDSIVYEVNKTALEKIDNEARRNQVAASYRHSNYIFTGQDHVSPYGNDTRAYLKAVSAKYDPERFFEEADLLDPVEVQSAIKGAKDWLLMGNNTWLLVFDNVRPSYNLLEFIPLSKHGQLVLVSKERSYCPFGEAIEIRAWANDEAIELFNKLMETPQPIHGHTPMVQIPFLSEDISKKIVTELGLEDLESQSIILRVAEPNASTATPRERIDRINQNIHNLWDDRADNRSAIEWQVLGGVFMRQGLRKEAIKCFKLALAKPEEMRAREQIETRLDLISLYQQEGKIAKCREQLEQINIDEINLNDRALSRRVELAKAIEAVATGELETATKHYKSLNRYQEEDFGTVDTRTIFTIHRLGATLKHLGRLDDAEAKYKQALLSYRIVLGVNNSVTLDAAEELAQILQLRGTFARAQELFEWTTGIKRKTLGKQHPSTAISIAKHAALCDVKGDFAGADEKYKEAFDIMSQSLGRSHPIYLATLENQALSYRRRAQQLFTQEQQRGEQRPEVKEQYGRHYRQAEAIFCDVIDQKLLNPEFHNDDSIRGTGRKLAKMYEAEKYFTDATGDRRLGYLSGVSGNIIAGSI